jgi:signal peptidase I
MALVGKGAGWAAAPNWGMKDHQVRLRTMMSGPPASDVDLSNAQPPGRPGKSGKATRTKGWLREGVALLAFIVMVGATRSSVADHYFVPTGSMIPTVEVGDRVVVNKLAYGVRVPFSDRLLFRSKGPDHGDVVVLASPEDGITLLKRVVAVPGDVVVVHEGQLWINGLPVPIQNDGSGLREALGRSVHPLQLTRGGGLDFGPVQVGPDQYLVMGDNRGESHDGRAFGLVERQAIFGKALSVWMRQGELCWRRL